MMQVTPDNWPYPRWVAHRGAGKLAPENTLAAFRVGASHGYRMFECDVKLSSDGVPFLLHDDSLARTTDSAQTLGPDLSPIGGDHPWATLARLDAGRWHSRRYAGEPLPTLEAVAHYCLHNSFFLNMEIKPSPGSDVATGAEVARHAARLWAGAALPPLLTSFSVAALEAALQAQPELPRGLLLDELHSGWLETAGRLACVAVVCHQRLWDQASMLQARSAALRTLSYTVNDAAQARRLLDLGLDAIITDRVDLFSPAS